MHDELQYDLLPWWWSVDKTVSVIIQILKHLESFHLRGIKSVFEAFDVSNMIDSEDVMWTKKRVSVFCLTLMNLFRRFMKAAGKVLMHAELYLNNLLIRWQVKTFSGNVSSHVLQTNIQVTLNNLFTCLTIFSLPPIWMQDVSIKCICQSVCSFSFLWILFFYCYAEKLHKNCNIKLVCATTLKNFTWRASQNCNWILVSLFLWTKSEEVEIISEYLKEIL